MNSKVLETLNQFVVSDYLKKLLQSKLEKKILHTVFPITGAPNLSAPRIFAMIPNPEKLIDWSKNLN